jgi:transcriptional regulator with XRE-family HTH domain
MRMKPQRTYNPRPLIEARHKQKISQTELAKRLNLDYCTINRAENGHSIVKPSTLQLIAIYLKVPFSDLQYSEHEKG